MNDFKIDAYSPSEMAEKVEGVGVKKARLDFWSSFALSVLAGAFIAFGGELFTMAVHDSKLSFGLTQLIGGLTFSLGLILVVVAGAELFTGNNLIVMAYVSRKVTLKDVLRNWTIVYIGNLVGSLTMVLWIYYSKQWALNSYMIGAKALLIANAKVNLDFVTALTRGVLCNALVCLAVWLCFSGRSVVDKIVSIIFPISAFVASGFEHSIANMYFIPMGLMLKNDAKVVEAAGVLSGKAIDLSNLTISGFLGNLIPVTIGNIFGGAVLVGIVYWFIYLRAGKA